MRVNDIQRLKSLAGRLKVQRMRIQENPVAIAIDGEYISSGHDADFYTILLRRIYRKINTLAGDFPAIKKIHSENLEFFGKIRIRDHFDHVEVDTWEDLAKIGPSKVDHLETYKNSIVGAIANITIVTSVIENKIISGPYEWDLDTDHKQLLGLIDDTIKVLEATPSASSEIDWKS